MCEEQVKSKKRLGWKHGNTPRRFFMAIKERREKKLCPVAQLVSLHILANWSRNYRTYALVTTKQDFEIATEASIGTEICSPCVSPELIMRCPKLLIRRSIATSLRMTLEMSNVKNFTEIVLTGDNVSKRP